MASFRTHYEVLGVKRSASLKEITIAYRKLALKNHPDKNKGDVTATERFQKISNAHDILKDENARAKYDASIYHHKAAWEAQQAKQARQQAQEQAEKQQQQSATAKKLADLESKKAMITKVIRKQQEEVLRLRSLWAILHSGIIPHGFEDYQAFGGDFQEVYTAIRDKLCELLLDIKTKTEKANTVAADIARAIEKFHRQHKA